VLHLWLERSGRQRRRIGVKSGRHPLRRAALETTNGRSRPGNLWYPASNFGQRSPSIYAETGICIQRCPWDGDRGWRRGGLAPPRRIANRPAFQPAQPNQRGDRFQARPSVEPGTGHLTRTRSHADCRAGCHLYHRVLERGVRLRRQNRKNEMELRSAGSPRARLFLLLRCREPRRRRAQRQSLCGHARRPSHRVGPTHWNPGLERPDHRSDQGILH